MHAKISQMPSHSSTGNQHHFKLWKAPQSAAMPDDELDEIFAPRKDSSTRIRIGGDGWIEKLDEAFRNDEAIALSALRNDEAVQVKSLLNQYVAQSRVKHLDLDLDLGLDLDLDLLDLDVKGLSSFGTGLSDYITAVTHFNLESFSLKVHMGEPIVYDGKGQCLVKLLEGENLTSLELHGIKLHEIVEGLLYALQSPKCHLSRLGLSPGWVPTRLVHAISSLASLQRLKLADWDGKAVIYLIRELAAPHCNIWDLELEMWCSSAICNSLADALQNPDCKLLLRLSWHDLIPFCNALQSPNCRLQHLHLGLAQVSSSNLLELGIACQTAHKLTSLSLSFNGYFEDFFTMFFQSNITHLSLSTQCNVTNVRLLQALEHPRCRLRHLRIRDSGEISKLNDQAEIVSFLERNMGCPLETLDIDWKSDALREHCSKILNRNRIYRHANQHQVEPSAAKQTVTIHIILPTWQPYLYCPM